ncbi:PAS-domain containing protein [Roseicitreum antarcticum]|uniref:PAS domain-containing protein n=1 Tax=Roseicitreum antarcticum TaxID=564137 RepID=A0A1H3BIP7_9RHOB|nr:PAS-domain containing protein [Roseicitreum antarcticum]SDX41822.1 PAS domain-containing protein [Roseicitreum antarcticum]
MESPLALAGLLVGTSALTSFGVLCLMAIWLKPKVAPGIAPGQYNGNQAVFVFDDTRLVDCNDTAAEILRDVRHLGVLVAPVHEDGRAPSPDQTEYAKLLRKISAYFPDFEQQASTLAQTGEISLTATGDIGMSLRAVWRRGLAHIILEDTRAEGGKATLDRLTYQAMEDELAALRALTDDAPVPMWREDPTGAIVWGNLGYLDLAQRLDGRGDNALIWPLPRVFPQPPMTLDGVPEGTFRAEVALRDTPEDAEQTLAFDITTPAQGAARVGYALPVLGDAPTDLTRRDLVQTLARAFTTLPVGLAVFDEKRRLQVFNPALTDLTGLPTEFLLSQPGFDRFLHQMREKRMLPEAADFTTWRAQLLAVERAADSGQYEENWTLADGRTFHVTGHPQPGGAIALFIDDISTDVALARTLRAAVDTGQAVLDALGDAVVVFSAKGSVVIDNAAYRALSPADTASGLHACSITQALGLWRAAFGAQTALDRVEAALRARIEIPQQHILDTPGGQSVAVSTTGLGNGQILVRFHAPQIVREAGPFAHATRDGNSDAPSRTALRNGPLIPAAVAAAARAPVTPPPHRHIKVRHSSNRADTNA